MIGRYARTELLVCDELGYLASPDGAAELVFQVLSERHERGSLILTTNLPFGEWTKVFPDPRLAKAVVDRLTHRAHIIDTATRAGGSVTASNARPRRSLTHPEDRTRADRRGLALARRPTTTGASWRSTYQSGNINTNNNPTPGGATSSHRAGASAGHHFHARLILRWLPPPRARSRGPR